MERLLYRVTGVDENHEMRWTEYAVAMLLFSVVSMLVLYLMQRVQGYLPFNPQKFGAVMPGASGVQHRRIVHHQHQLAELRAARSTMSYFTQMAGLAYHNFVSAAVGHRAGDCLHSRHRAARDGDHRQLLGRHDARCLWVLLPFCIVGALVLVSQGVVQNLQPYDTVKLVEPQQVQTDAAPTARPMTHDRHRADHRAGSGRFAGNHQGMGHQRRRLLQRQQRASVRESDAAFEPDRDVLHLRDRRRTDLHARPHDRLASATAGRCGRRWRFCFWPA